VGNGDIVPKTPTGRWAGVMIMVTGIAVLGLLSGSLASFFRLSTSRDAAREEASGADADQGDGEDPETVAGQPATAGVPSPAVAAALTALTEEVSALRRQVEVLSERAEGPG
jgi:voltage-gated potassium channel